MSQSVSIGNVFKLKLAKIILYSFKNLNEMIRSKKAAKLAAFL